MPTKRSATSTVSDSETKRQRKMLTIKEKFELLDMLKEGRTYAALLDPESDSLLTFSAGDCAKRRKDKTLSTCINIYNCTS
ncbi:hypothetical protein CHS0354_011707 [Potamilus streckersoni]|uniref:Uncharacterized protein n=1 Tax=Potamilus streckersoni TaxID=2493646 RepID=A0AAE0SJ14_9BIVA|nr:hypothetical protein CHS0354_011707 [Potamilus streckersoni]